MRRMIKGNLKLNIVGHAILRNFWEYYITELPNEDGIGMALVMGDYDEYGSITQYDIDTHGISYTTQLDDILPATGYSWADGVTCPIYSDRGV